jgi:hypothetical protein
MVRTLFVAALLWLTASGAVLAQAQQTDWSPFEEDPTCLVSRNDLSKPDATRGAATAQVMILRWHVWGDAFARNINGQDLHGFVKCFQPFEGAVDCGLPKNAVVGDVLWGVLNGKKVQPGDAADAYFSTPPPPDAIRFAARGVGRCFGKDSQALTLQELGLVRVDTSMDACMVVIKKIHAPWTTAAPAQIDREFAKRPDVAVWATVMGNLVSANAAKPVQACSVAPVSLAGILGGAAEKTRTDAARLASQAEASRIQLGNRTDAQRFAGLNGCQIAYSLVLQGINSRQGTVGKVPNAAIGWAMDYEKANLGGKACPPMPQALSDWTQKQPMATFQPSPDPYTAFRSSKGPAFGKTLADWRSFASTWMSRYPTQRVASGKAHSDCDAVLYYARSPALGAVKNADNGPSAFQTLARLAYTAEAEVAMCEYVPVSMLARARSAYAAEEARKRDAYAAEMRKREPLVPSTLPRQNYLWKNAPTSRCYWAGDTKHGQKEVCFSN